MSYQKQTTMQQVSEYQQQAIDFLTATGATLKFTYEGFKKYWDDDKQARNVYSWVLTRGNKTVKGVFGDSIADSCKPTPFLQSNEPVEIYAGLIHGNTVKSYFGVTINTTADVLNRIDKGELPADCLINMDVLQQEYNNFIAQVVKKVALNKAQRVQFTPTGVMSTIHSCKNFVQKRILAKIEELKKETVLLDQADNIVEPSAYDLLSCLTKYDPGTFENFCGDFGYDTDSRKALKTYRAVRKEWRDLEKMFNEEELQQLSEIC